MSSLGAFALGRSQHSLRDSMPFCPPAAPALRLFPATFRLPPHHLFDALAAKISRSLSIGIASSVRLFPLTVVAFSNEL